MTNQYQSYQNKNLITQQQESNIEDLITTEQSTRFIPAEVKQGIPSKAISTGVPSPKVRKPVLTGRKIRKKS